MVRYVVCSAALFAILTGVSLVLHSLQSLGLAPYLAICAVICCLTYLAARAYDARNPVQEVLPPEPRDLRPSKPSPRSIDAG